MEDYKKMYYKLFNKISGVVEDLQEIQRLTEDIFMNSPVTQLIVIKEDSGEDDL